MNFDKEFHKSSQYRYSIIISLISLLVGAVLQYFLGSIPKSWFSFPYNIIGGLTFVLFNTAIFFIFKKKNFINLHSSTPFAIVTVITLGVLTIGLGSISIDKGHHGTSSALLNFGFDDITKTWYFALIFLMALTNLWLAILKRSMVYQSKNITFLLNHFGLWLIMFAGVLGQGDLIRLKMDLYKDKIEWRATDDKGNVIELPLAIELKSFNIDIYPNKLFVIDSVGALPQSKPMGFMLEKDGQEGKILDWKITQHQYIEKAIPDTDSTYVSHGMWGATNAALITVENLKTKKNQKSWISAGNFQLPPRTITLDGEHTLVMAPAEARKFQSDVVIYQKDTEKVYNEKIEVNHPVKIDGWKIYQVSYDERMGRWSDLSVVELIFDPWLPVVYVGIFILMAGGVAFLFINRK